MSTGRIHQTSRYPKLTGRSKLFIVEPDKADVLASRKRIVRPAEEWPSDSAAVKTTSLGHSKSELSIREWDFYTALMKTELAYSLHDDNLTSRAYGAYLQHRGLLKWLPDNLRLTQTGVFSRKDSARTALSGRFGEALMYLYMVKSGYPYWDHLPSLAERLMETLKYSRKDKLKTAQVLSRPKRKDGKSVPEPDFVFEDTAKNVALAEAKGAFINPEDSPKTAKRGLSDGLKQAKLWQKHIAPAPQRCFAIGGYLREEHDPHPDPSLLAVVDPEKEDEGFRTLEFPDDWIRRGNYGGWMRGMGLGQSAELLAFRRNAELPRRTFLTVQIHGRSYAIVPIGQCVSPRFERHVFDSPPGAIYFYPRSFDVHVLGIESRNFSLIEKAVNAPDVSLPSQMAGDTVIDGRFPDWFSGSIMPDGTLNAILHLDDAEVPFDTKEFRL